jgi:transcriptional regulator
MYRPPAFAEDDPARSVALIRDNPFGILVTTHDGLQASHIPFVVVGQAIGFVLQGHLAAANPQCAALDGGEALAVFSGPHAYISPSWYTTGPAVPTWNYAAVHVTGRLSLLTDGDAVAAMLRAIGAHDPGFALDALPERYRAGMIAGIRAFTLVPDRVEGKWKMSQNRPEADRRSVIATLRASADPVATEVAALVEAALPAAMRVEDR